MSLPTVQYDTQVLLKGISSSLFLVVLRISSTQVASTVLKPSGNICIIHHLNSVDFLCVSLLCGVYVSYFNQLLMKLNFSLVPSDLLSAVLGIFNPQRYNKQQPKLCT